MNTLKLLKTLFITSALIFLFTHCSKDEIEYSHIKGTITVADSIDKSGDFSGIGYLVIKRDSTQAADTLFYAETDSSGFFEGDVVVPDKGFYPVYVTRNQKIIASSSIILAKDDTVTLKAELPGFNATQRLSSYEYTATDVFRRLNRNFARISKFVQAGKVKQDTIPAILTYWSNMYWSTYRTYPNTLASSEAVFESFRLLNTWNDSLLLVYYDSLQTDPDLRVRFADIAARADARLHGLESAISLLESIKKEAPSTPKELLVIRNQIDLLADSNKYERASAVLKEHQPVFRTVKGADSWAKYYNFEVNRLAPGKPLPAFKLATSKDSISNTTLKGKPFVLEVTGLTSQDYKQEITQVKSIIQLFKSGYNLEWITVPLDKQITIEAFIEENKTDWLFTNAHNFDQYRLMDSLNVIDIPTRFLVDENGKIIRKYGPSELNRLINDVINTSQNDENPNS